MSYVFCCGKRVLSFFWEVWQKISQKSYAHMFENKVQNMFLFMCVMKYYQIIHIQDGLITEVFIIWVLANLKLCRETKITRILLTKELKQL